MASLDKLRVGGRTYWRIIESRRVNRKPRPAPILYLGTADDLLQRLLDAPAGQLRIRSFQHGDVAALTAVARRLDVVSIIDRHVRAPRRRASVGTTLRLAALNRAVRPRSTRAWAAWAEGTSIHRLFDGLQIEKFTSQFFWDQMEEVGLDALAAIEEDLTRAVLQELDISLDTLFYDTTNFFTYIASTNPRPELPQRGHSKQKRMDLRIFNLALVVSREGRVPLCSRLYEGNRADVTSFAESLTQMRERFERLSVELEDLTIVYDKGNLSKANQAWVDQAPFGYVASLVPAHHPELMKIPVAEYRRIQGAKIDEVRGLRLTRTIWGASRTVLLFVSEQLRQGQIRGLQQHLRKRIEQLEAWKVQLAKPRSGPRTKAAAAKKVAELLSAQHLKQVLHIDYDPQRQGTDRLRYYLDEEARARLEEEVFGKRILITDRHGWTEEQILLAYRGQSEVEDAFRQIKDEEHMAVRPQYHWTDQKIQVHTFCCLLAFLLGRVIEWEARKLGYTEGLSGLLDLLGTIRLAMVLSSSGNKAGRPRCSWKIEEADPQAWTLYKHLVPHEPPFVYT